MDADVDVAASVNPANGEVTVTLVNRSIDESQEIAVRIEGAGRLKMIDGRLLSAEDFLPSTGFAEKALDVNANAEGPLRILLPKLSVARTQVITHD